MEVFPTSAIQFFISFGMLSLLSWRFYSAFKQTGSVYARYFSFILILIAFPLLYLGIISFGLAIENRLALIKMLGKWAVSICWVFHFVAFSLSAMTASLYFFPKISAKIAFSAMLILGIIVISYNLITAQTPSLTAYGVVNWNLNPAANLGYNILNAIAVLPLFLLFLVRAITNKSYYRAILIFFGLVLIAIFAPLPAQTTSFSSFILFSVFADIGLACAFSGILLHFLSQPIQKQP